MLTLDRKAHRAGIKKGRSSMDFLEKTTGQRLVGNEGERTRSMEEAG